jgi:hypothetical protein
MSSSWETALHSAFDSAFGMNARQGIEARMKVQSFYPERDIELHSKLAKQLFEAIVLALDSAMLTGNSKQSASKRVATNLITQIAQDIKAISSLIASGFPYQAASVAASGFEHSMMLVAIGNDDSLAEKWFKHSNMKYNIDSVKKLTRLAVDKLELTNSGIKAKLGDLYDAIYSPLCAFKHGNPMVQKYIHGNNNNIQPSQVFTQVDRRSMVIGYWAWEAIIRAGWLALVSFVENHATKTEEMKAIIKGINRSFNEAVKIRRQKEAEPN